MPSEPSASTSASSALTVRGLTKDYVLRERATRRLRGQRKVLHAVADVSFDLEPGAVLGLVGQSGSGKSTVARMLAQLEKPTAGEFYLGGTRLGSEKGHALRAYRRQVQMVFQDPFASLNPIHTVGHHLTRPLQIHGLAGGGSTARATVLALLDKVHLTPATEFIDKYPYELSGGQRQRVSIARALAVSPRVLLADEPVSMLDVSIRLSVLNLLADLVRAENLAMLYITHDIASARYFADTVLVMYAGRLVEGGPSEEVTQSPLHPYTRLLLEAAPDPDVLERLATPEAVPVSAAAMGEHVELEGEAWAATDADGRPARIELGNGHWAIRWLPDDLEQPGVTAAAASAAASAAWSKRGFLGPMPGTGTEDAAEAEEDAFGEDEQ